MKHLPVASYKIMPWKNGLGETAEIARFAADQSGPDFDWRVSVARVDGPGPFSTFPGVNRVIAQLAGPAMTLRFVDEGRVKTLGHLEPFAFPGEASIHAELAGPGRDFNVMVRREVLEADVSLVNLKETAETVFESHAAWLLLYCAEGSVVARKGRARVQAAEGDSILVTEPGQDKESVSVVRLGRKATLLVAELKPRR